MTPDEPTPKEPLKINVGGTVGVTGALGLHKTGPDSEALVVAETGWRANAESVHDTIPEATSEGRPSTGEADTLPCAARFVRFLRSSRGEMWWGEPYRVKEQDRPWLDCEAVDQRDPKGKRLQMQVQRAMIGEGRYKDWARDEQTGLPPGSTTGQAAAFILEAIENKRPAASPDVVLLLDAVRLPWLALGEVVAEVRRYAASAQKTRFLAVYIVPWVESAIRRLDQPE